MSKFNANEIKRTRLKALLVLSAVALFSLNCLQSSQKTPVTITGSESAKPIPLRVSDSTFKEFSHTIAEHKQFDCNSCHRREGKSLDMEFAAHESCIGCHLNQFTSNEPTMCAICHDDLQAAKPTMKAFPAKFNEGFNMKFDHADHDSGKGRPAQGCASCHAPAGPGKTIPSGFQAHNTCYTCHTAESQLSSCNVCHVIAPYNRTPQSRYVFRAVFTHGDHNSVGCSDCHNVIASAPQGRQVTSIAAAQHNCGSVNNCNTCHNGSRAFSGNDFMNIASCARCHSGSGFDMIPGGPCRN